MVIDIVSELFKVLLGLIAVVRSLGLVKRQVLILGVFCFLVSIGAIIHGIFFDLDWEQVKRLTLGGLVFTFVVVFPGALFIEWVFDINNRVEMDLLKKRVKKLEKKIRGKK